MALIDYGAITNTACRGAIIDILKKVAERGAGNLGQHEPHLTFLTRSPGLGLPDFVKAQFPERICLVFQHRFDDMVVDETSKVIRVSVEFKGASYRLNIPFGDITMFSDPNGIDGADGNAIRYILTVEPDEECAVKEPTERVTEGNVTRVNFGKKS